MDFLQELGDWFTANWWGPNGIVVRTWQHVYISVVATAAASVAALPLAIYLGHVRRGGVAAVAVVNIGRAIPSFAVLALALPISISLGLGLSFWPTLLALFVLAMPPIFTNAYTGVREVEPETVEAARGMGMTERGVLAKIELPIASPLILTGVRVAAVNVIATATLGAFVGFGGLGAFIREGLAQRNNAAVVGGAILVAALAIATLVVFYLVQRFVLPSGIRHVSAAPAQDATTREGELESRKVATA